MPISRALCIIGIVSSLIFISADHCSAFSTILPQAQGSGSRASATARHLRCRRLLLRLQVTSSTTEDDFFLSAETTPILSSEIVDAEILLSRDGEQFQRAQFLDLTLSPHRPLGCTVEESLGEGGYVFVSKVNEDSYGARGGLEVGDVLVACSNIFGNEMTLVAQPPSSSINDDDVISSKLKSESMMDMVVNLVTARPDRESLQLRVARGATVLQKHEAALVQLCANPGSSNSEIDECLLDYLKEGYNMPMNDNDLDSDDDDELCDSENDDDCMLDEAFDLWNQDLDYAQEGSAGYAAQQNEGAEPEKKKAKPWSSRASPSGTYVRDPKTGKLVNIDP